MGGVSLCGSGVLLLARKYLKSQGLGQNSSEELKPPSLGEPQMEELEGRVCVSEAEPWPLLLETLMGLVADRKCDTGREAERV